MVPSVYHKFKPEGWIGSGRDPMEPLETHMLSLWDREGSAVGAPAPCTEQHHGDDTQTERSSSVEDLNKSTSSFHSKAGPQALTGEAPLWPTGFTGSHLLASWRVHRWNLCCRVVNYAVCVVDWSNLSVQRRSPRSLCFGTCGYLVRKDVMLHVTAA